MDMVRGLGMDSTDSGMGQRETDVEYGNGHNCKAANDEVPGDCQGVETNSASWGCSLGFTLTHEPPQ